MVGEIFSVQAYHHLLTVVSFMITLKLNPRVYNSLLVLLAAVRLYRARYRVYRWLDTLPLYTYYELLVIIMLFKTVIPLRKILYHYTINKIIHGIIFVTPGF